MPTLEKLANLELSRFAGNEFAAAILRFPCPQKLLMVTDGSLDFGGDPFVASTWAVHPVLRHPSGAVDAMPDHPHESECLAPAPVAGNFAGVEEWPAPTSGGARIAPEVVSVSISAGRFIVSGAPSGTGKIGRAHV